MPGCPDLLLVTTSKSILLVDTAARDVIPVHRGQGLYYGIAYSDEYIFVAARRRMVSSDVPREEERGAILVFDKTMRLLGEANAPFPLRDMHEILWHEGLLWVTCSFDNMIAILDFKNETWDRWYPLGLGKGEPRDQNHFNSLAVREDQLLVLAHNWGPSEILSFEIDALTMHARRSIGRQAHNIRKVDSGGLLTCNSAEGAIVDTRGWALETGGFPRGIHIGTGARYVGVSEVLERKDRDLAHGRIAIFDDEWNFLDTMMLRGEGLVLDISPIPRGGVSPYASHAQIP